MGFVIGLFEFSRIAGIACLGVVGGLAIGMRIVLFKNGLIIHQFFVNWIIIAVCGVCGLVVMLWSQRIGIVSHYFSLFCKTYMNSTASVTDLMDLFCRHLFHKLRCRPYSQSAKRNESRIAVPF
jgi:hypothetical protein